LNYHSNILVNILTVIILESNKKELKEVSSLNSFVFSTVAHPTVKISPLQLHKNLNLKTDLLHFLHGLLNFNEKNNQLRAKWKDVHLLKV
jgi:hypothetical protein